MGAPITPYPSSPTMILFVIALLPETQDYYSLVYEVVENDECKDWDDCRGEERVDDEALGEPLHVVGVRAQPGHHVVHSSVIFDCLRETNKKWFSHG
jgi:hypothetical protein